MLNTSLKVQIKNSIGNNNLIKQLARTQLFFLMEKMENKTHGKAKNTKLKHNGQVYKKPTVLTKTVPYLRVGG